MPNDKNRIKQEILTVVTASGGTPLKAVAVVQSILMIGAAVVIVYFFGTGFAIPKDGQEPIQTLSATTNCPGTKLNYPSVITEDLPNGKKSSFRYNCIQTGFLATSYDGNCEGCTGRTRLTDEPVTWGICAVDTDVIPPKSTFYVPGYGPCKAADKGGGLKGKKIDVGFENTANGWWSRRYTDIFTFVN